MPRAGKYRLLNLFLPLLTYSLLAAVGPGPAFARVWPQGDNLPVVGCQFAVSVVAFSSQFGPTGWGWSATQALGPPDVYPNYGDISQAWASLTADDQPEFLELGFAEAAPINFVNIYETYGPGAITSISVRNPDSGLFEVVWTGAAVPAPEVSRLFTAVFPVTAFPVSEIRIDLDSPAVPNWNEIDAVAIGYADLDAERQWAQGIVGFSSEYDALNSAAMALGPPDVYPAYGDLAGTWASLTSDGQREFLELSYAVPSAINFVSVVETYAPGALDSISVKNPDTGLFETVWSDTATAMPPQSRILTIGFPETPFLVSEIRLDFDSPAVFDWNEIDAVAIGRAGCQATVVGVEPRVDAPPQNALLRAAPNPFSSSTRIIFSLSHDGPVKLDIFNVSGQRMASLLDAMMTAGDHEIRWDGRDAAGRSLAAGVYYLRIESPDFRDSRTLIKLR